jgi:hypothetical protein
VHVLRNWDCFLKNMNQRGSHCHCIDFSFLVGGGLQSGVGNSFFQSICIDFSFSGVGQMKAPIDFGCDCLAEQVCLVRYLCRFCIVQ